MEAVPLEAVPLEAVPLEGPVFGAARPALRFAVAALSSRFAPVLVEPTTRLLDATREADGVRAGGRLDVRGAGAASRFASVVGSSDTVARARRARAGRLELTWVDVRTAERGVLPFPVPPACFAGSGAVGGVAGSAGPKSDGASLIRSELVGASTSQGRRRPTRARSSMSSAERGAIVARIGAICTLRSLRSSAGGVSGLVAAGGAAKADRPRSATRRPVRGDQPRSLATRAPAAPAGSRIRCGRPRYSSPNTTTRTTKPTNPISR